MDDEHLQLLLRGAGGDLGYSIVRSLEAADWPDLEARLQTALIARKRAALQIAELS